MKPRTILQREVKALSEQLPKISAEQKAWAFENCLHHIGRRLKKGTTCMDCGHEWQETQKTCICPRCGRKLSVQDTKKRSFKQKEFFCIVNTHGRFQLIRHFEVAGHYSAGEEPKLFCHEILQQWMLPNGKYEFVSMLHHVNYYCNCWNGTLEIRDKSEVRKYDVFPTKIYPGAKVLPEIKRNGFKGAYHSLTPFEMFQLLLTNSKAETLLKAKQYSMFKYATKSPLAVKVHWPSIKICLRNNYIITDASTWIDYVVLLRGLGRDIHSPKYLCPENLKKEHDRYVEKERVKREREQVEEMKRKAAQAQAEKQYKKDKKRFFGIEFSDGVVKVMVLKSVSEFISEGDELHHCVFSGGYYNRKESLILSAQVEGKRVETVEISLTKMEVVQCRGVHNKNTKYHKQILKLVKQNMGLIKKAA